MKKINILIVDDELDAREGVKSLLEEVPETRIIGLCKNGIEAIDMINEYDIDLVLLDIQMPVINGFEVINSISKDRLPHIIFITAYDQYALKAFEVHAIDYILKPFTNQRFYQSLERAKRLIHQNNIQNSQDRLKSLSESYLKQNIGTGQHLVEDDIFTNQRLVIKEKGKVHFVILSDIIWLEAFDYYVKIHVKDKFYLIRDSLKKLSSKLPEEIFMQVHKSSTVNINAIQSIESTENGEYHLKLTNGEIVKVSRSYRYKVRNMLNQS